MPYRKQANRQSRKITLWIIAALPLLALVAASISVSTSVWMQWRQDDLDHRLIQAIKLQQTDKAVSLLNHGASANAQDIPYKPLTLRTLVSEIWARLRRTKPAKEQHPSALMLACTVRWRTDRYPWEEPPADLPLVRALLSHKAEPNTFDQAHGFTALETQVMAGDPRIVKLLLEHGAWSNWSMNFSQPILLAVFFNRVDVASAMLGHGADIHARFFDGTTVLHAAASFGSDYIPMCDLLLAHNADINAQDKHGRTPLMDACEAGPEDVRFLLRRGADASIRTSNGETALDLTKVARNSSGKRAIVHLLAEAEALRGSHRRQSAANER